MLLRGAALLWCLLGDVAKRAAGPAAVDATLSATLLLLKDPAGGFPPHCWELPYFALPPLTVWEIEQIRQHDAAGD